MLEETNARKRIDEELSSSSSSIRNVSAFFRSHTRNQKHTERKCREKAMMKRDCQLQVKSM